MSRGLNVEVGPQAKPLRELPIVPRRGRVDDPFGTMLWVVLVFSVLAALAGLPLLIGHLDSPSLIAVDLITPTASVCAVLSLVGLALRR